MIKKKIDRDALNYSRICSGKRYSYAVCEDGTVMRTQHSNMKESKAKVTLISGRAFIYIGRIGYKLDSLVAKHFIPGYKPNSVIEHIDGNPRNCAVWNLRIIPRREYNKGRSRNGLAKPVTVGGEVYPSVQSAAKALFVDTSTLHKYLRGQYENSMLDGTGVKFLEVNNDE